MKKWQQTGDIGNNIGFSIMLFLIKILPHALLILIAFPVSAIYFFVAGTARKAIRKYLDKVEPLAGKKLSVWKSFVAFSITLIEKCEGWVGKVNYSHLHFRDDSVDELNNTLKSGKGVFLIVSHIGSAEEMRALSEELSKNKLGMKIPVLSLVDFEVTDKFNSMLKKLNPDSMLNLLSVRDLSIDGIERIQTTLDDGGIVIIAGDRSGDRNIEVDFLGEPAQFPFGAFYLPLLFESPSFFCVCVRTRDMSLKKSYEIYVELNMNGFEKPGKSARKAFAESSCKKYAVFLEKLVQKYPYQWYNFYDFWSK